MSAVDIESLAHGLFPVVVTLNQRFTRDIAEEVRTSGVQKALEPMGSADRKIVHDTVNELDGVSTISEGDEPRRRVVILPS